MSVTQYTDEAQEHRTAIKQLWSWAEKQREKKQNSADKQTDVYGRGYERGGQIAYANVRLYMRKFFSGLINFDSEGEGTDERLPSDV